MQTLETKFCCENCAICRCLLAERCMDCNDKIANSKDFDKLNNCILISGKCKHYFHLHCIERWLSNRNVCPLCNREWKYPTLKNIHKPKSLQQICCKKIAKYTKLVLECAFYSSSSYDRISKTHWKWINKYSKSWVIYSCENLNADCRQAMAKHFNSYGTKKC